VRAARAGGGVPAVSYPERPRRGWSRIATNLAEAGAMDFALTEQHELIRKEVSSLARSFPPEYWLEKDGKAEYPFEFVKAFAQAGWLGVIIPEEYGGSGLGATEAALMLHDIAASGAGTSGCSPIHF